MCLNWLFLQISFKVEKSNIYLQKNFRHKFIFNHFEMGINERRAYHKVYEEYII
jgi:hypothetical protein